MLRVGVLALVASACGRVAFDAHGDASPGPSDVTPDVLLGHDEDGDGIADEADTCPHIADPSNADTDGDLVGDACDPEPGAASQQWLFFSPMTGSLPWSIGPDGAWTMNADDWSYIDAPNQAQLIRTGAVADVDVWVGFDVETVGTGGVQAAIIINGTMVPYWYGELYDGGSGARLSITEYDGASYIARSSTPIGAAFPLGPVELHLTARTGGAFTLRAGALSTTFDTPGYAGDELIILAFGNHVGRVRYIAICDTHGP